MKNILYVYAHPNPDSLNNSMKQCGCELLQTLNYQVVMSDLYAAQFNAVASWQDFNLTDAEINQQYFLSQQIAYNKHALASDIATEIEKLNNADHIIFQFPLWWFSVPAILKGWLDRVLVKGFAYDAGKILNEGLLKGKTASLVLTTQSPESAYQVDGAHGSNIDAFLHSMHHTLRFVGVTTAAPFVVYTAFNIDANRYDEIIKNYQAYLRQLS